MEEAEYSCARESMSNARLRQVPLGQRSANSFCKEPGNECGRFYGPGASVMVTHLCHCGGWVRLCSHMTVTTKTSNGLDLVSNLCLDVGWRSDRVAGASLGRDSTKPGEVCVLKPDGEWREWTEPREGLSIMASTQ